MWASEYQNAAMRTNDHRSWKRMSDFFVKPNQRFDEAQLFNATLGLSGETGEFNDALKKMIFHEKPFDANMLQKELGDILWYITLICDTFGWSLDSIMKTNLSKLAMRYPNGFDTNRSNNKEG